MNSVDDLLSYLHASPSPYHCVEESARRLRQHGFVEVDEKAEPKTLQAGSGGYIRRAGTLIAWRAGSEAPAAEGFRLLGAHTDSPNLRVKPRPDVHSEGYWQWGVEVYGGVLLATWTDRDLGLAGRVFIKNEDGTVSSRLLCVDRPIARIPNLAIHLNRRVNEEGLTLNAQKHLAPLLAVGEDENAFSEWLQGQLNVETVLSWDLGLFDVQPPSIGGLHDEFVFSARLDNQASCHAALSALLAAKTAKSTQVIVLFDHEEVGSRSAQGAMGGFLRDVLACIERDHEMRAKGGLERAIANSFLVSLDMAHGVHPNYADLHEKNHKPMLNAGPVIKEHAEQRYATDGESTAWFRLACEEADVPCQDFVVRTDLACGSTIGPISSAQLGMRAIDVGAAMLSMHSIREQCGTKDVDWTLRVLTHALER